MHSFQSFIYLIYPPFLAWKMQWNLKKKKPAKTCINFTLGYLQLVQRIMFATIINLEVFKINRYQAPFIKSPCPTNIMTGCNIASVVELSSTGEIVESQTVTIPSPFPEIMYCPDLYQKIFKQGLEWGEQVGGGRDGVRRQVRKPQKVKMINKRCAAETLNLFSLPLSHIQRNKSFHPLLVFQSQEP